MKNEGIYLPFTIFLISFSLFNASRGGQIIDIQIQNLIPYLTQYRIIQLEEDELHSAPAGRYLSRRLGNALLAVVRFQLMQNIIGAPADSTKAVANSTRTDSIR